jgi:hypothetical protein
MAMSRHWIKNEKIWNCGNNAPSAIVNNKEKPFPWVFNTDLIWDNVLVIK